MDQVIIGVDTHESNHVAVAINVRGARLGEKTMTAPSRGDHDLEVRASGFGHVKAFGIDSTGSCDAGLGSHRFRELQALEPRG